MGPSIGTTWVRRHRSWETEAAICVVLGVALVAGVVAYDAAEQIYPVVQGIWSASQEPARQDHERLWDGVRATRTIRRTTIAAAALAREALAGVALEGADSWRAELQQVRSDQAAAIAAYEGPDPVAAALTSWSLLRDLLRQYWEDLDRVTATPHGEQAVNLLTDLETQQTAILHQTERVSEIHLRPIHEQENRSIEWNRQLRLRALWATVVCLLSAMLVSAAPLGYALRAERRLQAEYQRTLHAKKELQRLSAELVRVQEEERRSLSRELHDQLGQTLTAARLEMALLERKIPSQMSDLQRSAHDGKILVEQTLERVRDLCRLLRPGLLDEQGLGPAVRWLIDGFTQRTGMVVDYDFYPLDQRFSPEYELAAYRMVQEALTNVARHSGATRASVRIEALDGTLWVGIGDNGSGMKRSHGGLGLVGMRERVEQLGGRLIVDSAPGLGVRLTADIPLPEAATSVAELCAAAS